LGSYIKVFDLCGVFDCSTEISNQDLRLSRQILYQVGLAEETKGGKKEGKKDSK
jgi:hypothetical protein